jgi:hypothetical protein
VVNEPNSDGDLDADSKHSFSNYVCIPAATKLEDLLQVRAASFMRHIDHRNLSLVGCGILSYFLRTIPLPSPPLGPDAFFFASL